MPGTERSGRKGLGEVLLADALFEHLRRDADLLRMALGWLMRREEPDGCALASWARNVEEQIERSHSLVMQQEITASKTTLARALLEGDDVTDACLKLAMQSRERYGPLIRLTDAA